jgi:hypothetical protein
MALATTENEILQLICRKEQKIHFEIADQLCLSPRTRDIATIYCIENSFQKYLQDWLCAAYMSCSHLG